MLNFDRRIGIGGLVIAVVGIAITILYPDAKWLGWVSLAVGILGLALWLCRELVAITRTTWVRIVGCLLITATAISIFLELFGHYEQQAGSDSISIAAFATLGYEKDAEPYGIKWLDDRLRAVRISIDDKSPYPILNLELTVTVMPYSNIVLAGMGQMSKIPNVDFQGPDMPDLHIQLRGQDGKDYDLSTRQMGDENGGQPQGGFDWRMSCARLSPETQLRLLLATNHSGDPEPPKKLRFTGSYEVGGNLTKFDKVVDVKN